jgi:hypothetical protein
MLKLELKRSNSNEVVTGSLDIRIAPVEATQQDQSSLQGQFQALGLTGSSSNGESSSGPATLPGAPTNKPVDPSPSNSNSGTATNALSSVEDQFGPLPPG